MDRTYEKENTASISQAESVPDAKAKRRSSTRRVSFNPRQSFGPVGTFCDNPAAMKIYKNMRRAVRARFEAAKDEIAKAGDELGLGSEKLEDLYKQLKSLKNALGSEGDVLHEELLYILAETATSSDGPLEQGPMKKARLDGQPSGSLISPVTEIAKRLDEWNTSDGVQEIQQQLSLDPLDGLNKGSTIDQQNDASAASEEPDALARELAAIQKLKATLSRIDAQHREMLLKRRTEQLKQLPSHIITVERLAKRLAGTIM